MRNEPTAGAASLAENLTLKVFMLQVSLELARRQPEPLSWARRFVDDLHSRIGEGVAPSVELGKFDPVRELALAHVEALERDLSFIITEENVAILR